MDYKLQIMILIIQLILMGLIIFFYKKNKDLISEYQKNLTNAHNYEMKLLKLLEKQNIENMKSSNESFENIKNSLNELNHIEEIK